MTHTVATPELLWLPPQDAWLINPKVDKIDTPVDHRGLIDINRLISDVKNTIDPTFEWPLSPKSIHHIYWPMTLYPYDEDAPGNPGVFRNLAIHKALVPRIFENWLHAVTLPPALPEPEVREYSVEAWNVARDLFKMARGTVKHEKRARRRRDTVEQGRTSPKYDDDRIAEEWIQEGFDKHFRGWEHQVKRYYQIPSEFRLFKLDGSPLLVAEALGKIVMPKSLKLIRAVAA